MQGYFPIVDYVVDRQTYHGWRIPERTIHNYELVFIMSGQCSVTIENIDYIIKKNDVVCFYPGKKHSLTVLGEPYARFYGVHFTLSKENEKLNLPNIFSIKNTREISSLLNELERTWVDKDYLFEWKQNLLLSQIMYTVHARLHQEPSPANSLRINRAIDYIHKNPYIKHSVQSLCTVAGMKKSYFMANFKKLTGFSPIKYCGNLKLEHSKTFLVNTNWPINEIARHCGFSDEFYYSRMFKRFTGLSPSEFRK